MSLCEPGIPKNICHIQRSYEATASKIIVGSRMWPEYIPFQTAGQFFHFQCMQSMLPNIPGNPHSFGDRKYSSEKTLTIVLENRFRLSITVLLPIRILLLIPFDGDITLVNITLVSMRANPPPPRPSLFAPDIPQSARPGSSPSP
ncbi:hypothetical protein I3760_15G067400 [Carya illinoinensis]|nr:hypothetical protein I3760_15G067400 [Carya illinoinensis]